MNTVTDIVKRFNVSADTIRHYTKLGLLSPDRDPVNSYRLYRLEDESHLRFILSAKKLGFRLKEIKQILQLAANGDTPCPLVRELIEQRIQNIRQEILDAQRLMIEMEKAVDQWQSLSDRAPLGVSICHLIDVWSDQTNDLSTRPETSHLS